MGARAVVRSEIPEMTGRPDRHFMSDAIAQVLREIDVEYVALVTGSSLKGLHDSIVNFLGNERPQLITVLDELTAVGVAHGYAKATGRMMAAALHGNVGVLRGSMAIFNAWCDRAPVLLLGGTGPDNETQRRLSDWVHTSIDNAGLVREFLKWDAHPRSAVGAIDALLRARQIARTAPQGPAFVDFSADFMQAPVKVPAAFGNFDRYAPPGPTAPSPQDLAAAKALLSNAANPVILLGRCSHDDRAWHDRIALAESLNARVVTLIRQAAAFPTDHPLHAGPPFFQWIPSESRAAIARSDLILALDYPDLQDTLLQVFSNAASVPRVISVSCDIHNHRGGSGEVRGLAPADLHVACDPDMMVRGLLGENRPEAVRSTEPPPDPPAPGPDSPLDLRHVAAGLWQAARGIDVTFTRLPFRWPADLFPFHSPRDYLGYDGGSGIGSGPGISVGAALGLAGSDRLPIAVMGDGDFLMGNTAIWTAVHYDIPLLVIVANNRSFQSTEHHLHTTARERGRPVGNSAIGCNIAEPAIDIAAMARSMGAEGFGPVTDARDLTSVLAEAVAQTRAGKVVVVDVVIP